MQISRRTFCLGLGALGLGACGAGPSLNSRDSGALPADLRPSPNADYSAWVSSFKERALAQGISQSTLNAAFRGTGYLPGVIKRDRN